MRPQTAARLAERPTRSGVSAVGTPPQAGADDPATALSAASATSGSRRVRHLSAIRVRVLGWYVLLLVLATMASVSLERKVLIDRLDARVDRQLALGADRFRDLVRTTPPAADADPASHAASLFDTFLRENSPGDGGAFFTIVDGERYGTSFRPPHRLDRDPALVRRWESAREPLRGAADTPVGEARWLAVPVQRGATTAGVLVVAAFPAGARAEVDAAIRVAGTVSFSVLFLASALAWVVAGRVLRPVRSLTETARSIREHDIGRRIDVHGSDELAELATTFNAMLDRLEHALDTQRQFISDAGHELRTPITIIQGHLDVMGDDPAERAETMALIHDELDRMCRFVEDLLLLAKAERPGFIEVEAVDLEVLGPDLLAKASALGDREWVLAATSDATVLADRQRLTQAVVNLAQNAVQHTTDGSRIELGIRTDDRQVRLFVRDSGPGVPPADQERIFQRFARSRGSQRRSEGAGLGLAIVRSIAEGHGGTVELVSVPGQGATFTVVIPLRAA